MTALISLTSAPDASAPNSSAPSLAITHGLHRGGCLPLNTPTCVVGSAGNADVLLSDAGIAERHMILRFRDGHVVVEAVGGDVTVIARRARPVVIPVGNGHRARMPFEIRIGEAQLTLTDTAAAPEAEPRPTPVHVKHWRWLVALALIVVCLGAFATRGEPPVPNGVASVSATPSPDARRPSVSSIHAKAWLEQRLAETGLTQISVSESGGQLSVNGSYGPSHKGQWTGVQKAFDERFGQQVVLHANVVPRAEVSTPRVRFQAVWFGPNPYVVNDSGKRLYPGAALADNWTLERIENNQVVLARGVERFTFTL